MMNKNFFGGVNVKNVINTFIGGQRGVCVVADVVVKAASLINKADEGRLVKVVCWTDRPLVSYSGDVNAKSDEKFVPQPPKGFVYTQYPFFKKAIKSGIEYLVVNFRLCDKGGYEEKYYLDGVLIDNNTAQTYLKPKKEYERHTQIAVGVTDVKEQTRVVQYEIDKVRYVGLDKAKAMEIYESVGD
jgi:hypothetical protein